jgi:UDP-galactopyranose mutase
VADAQPDWSLVMVGPVVKIDEAKLPRRPNIHYLGGKSYAELPRYLAGWDVALMPFAVNEATKFISPTKTPEYLSGGVPVVSTPSRTWAATTAAEAVQSPDGRRRLHGGLRKGAGRARAWRRVLEAVAR